MSSSRLGSHTTISSQTLLLFAVGALLLALPLALNVMNRVRAEQRMRQAVAQMSAQTELNKQKLARLADAEAYVRSDAYIEHWARVQQHWVKNGEVPVIVSATDSLKPKSQPWWEQFLNQ